MSILILLQGLPASGKSTWAKNYMKIHKNTKRVNKDDLRAMINDSVWSGDNEKYVLQVRDLIITSALKSGFDVIVDDTNLSPKHINRIRAIVPKNTKIIVNDEFLNVSLKECISRDAERDKPVGAKVIQSMHSQFLSDKKLTREDKSRIWLMNRDDNQQPLIAPRIMNREDCIICDIDGTVAKTVNRSPFDYTKVLTDAPYFDVIECVTSMAHQYGAYLFMVSGREGTEQCRQDTLQWLADYEVTHDGLYMRPEGDFRKDVIIKQEIYIANFKDRYNTVAVFDDRDQTVKGWRDLGLRCYQVCEGNF